MPTLNWIGKDKVLAHHQEVPYHILDSTYTYNAATSGNRIIHGDNLTALKSLLPQYEGRIKCIYIDPPYNTGNEGWVYNDRVNDPKILKWLHSVVGKEGEDLSRHDKWLCMMYPRLRLLHKLLAPDGAIFISIDDNEQASLKMMMDEIFGKANYLTSLMWRRRASSQMSQNNISVDHEYVVAYSKSDALKFSGIRKDYKNYSNPDNDKRGPWTLGDLTVGMTKDQRPNQFFDLIDPHTGNVYPSSSKRVWTYAPDSMKIKIAEGKVVFPKTKSGKPMLKRYLEDLKTDINPFSSWMSGDAYEIGLNSEGTKIIQALFNDKVFDYSKPVSLLTTILSQVTGPNDIILDSFAGSGTTAHAVLNLNQRDGGHRKFILIEMEAYAGPITAERVKRVIDGYGGQAGTGGSFTYATVGAPLFHANNTLNEAVPTARIREYIWYSETATPLRDESRKTKDERPEAAERAASNGEASPTPQAVQREASNPYFLGSKDDSAYYFYYEPDALTTLDDAFLSTIRHRAATYIIYADTCLLSKPFMQAKGIIFKKIPRDITRF